MGNANCKPGQLPNEHTGLTDNEVKLIQQTWRNFRSDNHEYGVLLFLAMFAKHPHYLKLFKNFQSNPIVVLKDDPAFRAHGCSIGYHITSMVESVQDPPIFEELVRRNATEHLRRKGVTPHHFQVMGQCMVNVLQATDERHMTPAAISAWGKFLECMVTIIKDVYDKADADREDRALAAFSSAYDNAALTQPFRTANVTGAENPEELQTAMITAATAATATGTTITTAVAKSSPQPHFIGRNDVKKRVQSPKTDTITVSPQQQGLSVVTKREKTPVKDVIAQAEQAH